MSSPSPSDLPTFEALTPPALRPKAALPLSGGRAEKPSPLGSVTASAQRLTTSSIDRNALRPGGSGEGWQADAWEMYDLIGEQRFLANTLAGRAAQARLFVGRLSHEDPLAEPEPVEDLALQAILDGVGKTSAGRGQLVLRMVINFFVAGEGYLVGFPPSVLARARGENVTGLPGVEPALADLEWRVLSIDELTLNVGQKVEVRLAESGGKKIELDLDDLYVVRAWRSHPRRAWQADSPTRSSLPVLRELVALTMAISSSTDSRLAGAGVLVVPDSARRAMLRAAGLPEDSPEDPLAEALIDAMSAAISDRSSAAAFTPLVLTVPDEAAPLLRHMTFDKQFDKELAPLRDEAIRRLALGQDAPPELLLGVGSMNHWGAWLVREDVVTTHLEPPLALFCDAITTQLLRPAMLALGYPPEVVDDHVIWYDVSHMIVRPNRGTDALELYDRGEVSGEAARTALGFDENDAPVAAAAVDRDVELALKLVAQAPGLVSDPGLPAVVAQIRAVREGAEGELPAPDVSDAEADAPPVGGDTIPATSDDDADPDAGSPGLAASAAAVRLARTDGMVGEAAIEGLAAERDAGEADGDADA